MWLGEIACVKKIVGPALKTCLIRNRLGKKKGLLQGAQTLQLIVGTAK
jgi:hypothetical protein